MIFRKKGMQSRDLSKREHPLTNDIETSENSLKITSCTHLNGHHSVRQSCPKTSKQAKHFSSSSFFPTKNIKFMNESEIDINLLII